MGIKRSKAKDEPVTADQVDEGFATELVRKLVDLGIDGVGPLDSAATVAQRAVDKYGDVEKAIDVLASQHVKVAAAGGFITGVGGIFTMPVSLPANVIEFYVVATRLTAAVAHLRGYDLSDRSVRTAILLVLMGADAEDILAKAGLSKGLSPTARLGSLATRRLPPAALMVVNKGIGFRLVTQVGQRGLAKLGKVVPLVGGAIGAGLDGYLLKRIGDAARRELPRIS